MNHATPKAPINEQTHPASPHHREPSAGEGSRTRESSDRSLTSPAANALDWKICALGSSFDLDEVLAAAPATEILPELDALVPPNPNASPKPIRRVDQPRSGLTLLELVVVLLILVALAGVVVPLVGDSMIDAREKAAQASLTALRDVVSTYWIDSGSAKRLPRPNHTSSREDAPQLEFLFVNPDHFPAATFTYDKNYRFGWRGPYLRQATGTFPNPTDRVRTSPEDPKPTYADALFFGTNPSSPINLYGEPPSVTWQGDSVILDPWENPIVIQNPNPSVVPKDVRLVSAGPNGRLQVDPFTPTANLGNTGDDIYVSFTLR